MKRCNYFAIAILLCCVPLFAGAATLVNINTANSAELQTLSGIGPSKAQAIIDYRSQSGPFATIEDIQNVSGIGPSTYNNIKDFITVGTVQSPPEDTQTQTQTQTATTSMAATTAGPAGSPPAITATIEADSVVTVGGGSYFSLTAYGTQGVPLQYPRVLWNFGDGTVAEGERVLHTFAYPGRYVVEATVAYNFSTALARKLVQATPAQVSLRVEADGSVTLVNNSDAELDAGAWLILQGGRTFTIPDSTTVLAGEGVRFAPAVLGFSATGDTRLLYPNQMVAASPVFAQDAPQRGVRVSAADLAPVRVAAPIQKVTEPALVDEQNGEVLGAETESSQTNNSSALWWSLGGLVVVLAVGAGSAWYLRPKPFNEETSLSAEEFDIEG